MSNLSLLKQLGSVKSVWLGNSDIPGEPPHVGAKVSVLCDIRTKLCAVSKLRLHAILTFPRFCKEVLVNVSVQECCMYAKCNCDVVTFWVFVSIMRAHSRHCFQRQCRWCRCKHPGLSAPLITIETFQNFSELHATVLLSIDPSRLYHLLLSSLLFYWIVNDCQDFRLPGIVIPRIRFHTRR